MYPLQVQALRTARGIIRSLPPSCIWSLVLTDDIEQDGTCGVLNVFVDDETARVRMRRLLRLTKPTDEGDDYETHKVDEVLVSIIEGRYSEHSKS